MKSNNLTVRNASLAILFLLLISGAATNAAAQKTRQPRPTPSPIIEPEIVSRAGDYDENQTNIVTTGTTAATTAEAIENEQLKDRIKQLKEKIKTLENSRPTNDAADPDKKLLMSLDILSRAEARAETLRRQFSEVTEKENTLKTRIEQINYEMEPAMLERSTALAGSLRPEDLRDARKKSLQAEKDNLENLLFQIQTNRSNLETSVQRADAIVEKIRLKFEKEIDTVLEDSDDSN